MDPVNPSTPDVRPRASVCCRPPTTSSTRRASTRSVSTGSSRNPMSRVPRSTPPMDPRTSFFGPTCRTAATVGRHRSPRRCRPVGIRPRPDRRHLRDAHRVVRGSGYHGCPFINASAEADPTSPSRTFATTTGPGYALCSPAWPARPGRVIPKRCRRSWFCSTTARWPVHSWTAAPTRKSRARRRENVARFRPHLGHQVN